jgi:hypothetical protein
MSGAVLPPPNTPSWHGAQLGGAQGQLYLYLIFSAASISEFCTAIVSLLKVKRN